MLRIMPEYDVTESIAEDRDNTPNKQPQAGFKNMCWRTIQAELVFSGSD